MYMKIILKSLNVHEKITLKFLNVMKVTLKSLNVHYFKVRKCT